MNNAHYSRYYTFVRPVLRNKEVKTYSSLIFSILLSIVLVIFAVQPALNHIAELEKSIQQQKEILAKLKEKSTSIAKGYSNYENIDGETKNRLANLLPNKTRVTSIVNILSNSVLALNATISALQFQPTDIIATDSAATKKPIEDVIAFTLSSPLDYSNAITFLDSLGKLERLFRVDSITLSKKDEDATTILTISGKAYSVR